MNDPRPQRIASKPVPSPTKASYPFWDAARRGVLAIPQCRSCGHRFFYPRIICPRCASSDIGWYECSGRGLVHSYTTMRMSFWGDAFAGDVPYNVSYIELEEGVKIVSNVVGIDPEDVKIGLPVAVIFVPREGYQIPIFQPIEEA